MMFIKQCDPNPEGHQTSDTNTEFTRKFVAKLVRKQSVYFKFVHLQEPLPDVLIVCVSLALEWWMVHIWRLGL